MTAPTGPSSLARSVVRDPEWLAHRYDPAHDAFQYRRVPRAAHARAAFLTDDLLGPAERMHVLTRAQAAPLAPSGQIHFIFHSAFCASTMLARALDRPGSAMALSEPVILNDMVGWRRRGAAAQQHGRVLVDVLGQLARPFGDGEAVVIKPSNVLNPLAAGILALRPDARAVLLHAPLPVFLASVARKGLQCRLWCRELLEGYLQDGFVALGFEPREYFRLTDLQVAAVGWLAQHAFFASVARRFGAERIATLNSEQLTAAPAVTVASATRHLGLVETGTPAAALHRDSKTGAAFAPGQRERDQAAARTAHGEEIAMVIAWADELARRNAIAADLPFPLAD